MKIVSLLPSATETICLLGLRDQLVGVSHECDYPAGVEQLPRVTTTSVSKTQSSRQIDSEVRAQTSSSPGLYSLDVAAIHRLQPDLIVTQSLCDVCAVAESEVRELIETLPEPPRVLDLAPACLSDLYDCVRRIGVAAGCSSRADEAVANLRARVDAVRLRAERAEHHPTVVLLEWIDPPFSAGHWSPELVRIAGGRELIGHPRTRSQNISWEQLIAADPELLMLACCGLDVSRTVLDVPILQSVPGWQSLNCVRSGRVYAVDGNAFFNRPGPRLVDSVEILAHTLDPKLHPLPAGLTPAVNVLSTVS